MRTDKHVPSNNHFVVPVFTPSGTPVEGHEDGSAKSYGRIVPAGQCLWMQLIDINKLADPYVLPIYSPILTLSATGGANASANERQAPYKPV